jgi:hypothetical protein
MPVLDDEQPHRERDEAEDDVGDAEAPGACPPCLPPSGRAAVAHPLGLGGSDARALASRDAMAAAAVTHRGEALRPAEAPGPMRRAGERPWRRLCLVRAAPPPGLRAGSRQTADTCSSSATRKLEPQPQAATTFGLFTWNPAPWSEST